MHKCRNVGYTHIYAVRIKNVTSAFYSDIVFETIASVLLHLKYYLLLGNT